MHVRELVLGFAREHGTEETLLAAEWMAGRQAEEILPSWTQDGRKDGYIRNRPQAENFLSGAANVTANFARRRRQ